MQNFKGGRRQTRAPLSLDRERGKRQNKLSWLIPKTRFFPFIYYTIMGIISKIILWRNHFLALSQPHWPSGSSRSLLRRNFSLSGARRLSLSVATCNYPTELGPLLLEPNIETRASKLQMSRVSKLQMNYRWAGFSAVQYRIIWCLECTWSLSEVSKLEISSQQRKDIIYYIV